ncbi:GAF domain-containing sensor histidine kinase [Pedobacter psychroterrae]|uniref:histidine kinase n=1 Tax=Pedobacter psychroterrae TaxID=2530453 RepID=A0A4R0ND43_9SPHI|nr:GAF domain-containing sensor histidine kinase [Pedobacter psychroterrae]TCC98168.1 GAF domain-containing sensor histidine kinase [Pedobacter psychroterrae]
MTNHTFGETSGVELKLAFAGDESARVAALHSYHMFDTEEEKDFDVLTALASAICQIPIVLITFIDETRQTFKSHHGTDFRENLRELSFCTHTIASSEEIMIVPDARQDARFVDNPMVTGPTKVVFYAGVSLINEDGFALGTLCVIDQKTHSLSDDQVHALKTLAKQVVDKIELRRKVRQLEKANQELAQSEQRKDDFLGMVSHELKTPITTLKANLQLIDKLKHSPAAPVFSRIIDSSARSLVKINGMVDDLLNMYRYSENQLQLEKTTFTIYDMLHVCCNHVRIDGKHELVITGDDKLQMHADEHRIDQVVVNFVNNAVKYAPDSKEIYLNISREGSYVKISVKDTGPGIPDKHLPHLFDRYWRADHSGVKYTGLGLGLYICSEIIKRHDGHIGAESELGKGSTFWFKLPVAHLC